MTELYNLLPIGQANAINISTIAELWGMSPREARKQIDIMMREHHLPVCNLFNGYFRPENIDELIAYRKIIASYRNKLCTKYYHIDKCVSEFNNTEMNI